MKLYINTTDPDERTEIIPNESGNTAEYYAYCIQTASAELNDTFEGRSAARHTFRKLMSTRKETIDLVIDNLSQINHPQNDAELIQAMSGYVIRPQLVSESDLHANPPRPTPQEYHQFCVQNARGFLNNTATGLLNAKAAFFNNMNNKPETAEAIAGERAALINIASNDNELIEVMEGYAVFSSTAEHNRFTT